MAYKDNNEGSILPQIIAILSSSLLGISEGMLFAWNSPAIPALITDYRLNITLEDASYFTLISPVAMAITAPLFPLLMDVIGRRNAVLLGSLPVLLAWIFVILSNNIWMYYISRFFSGVVEAAAYTTVPVYVCEIAQPGVRDIWGNIPSICMYLGVFLVNVIGSYNSVMISASICAVIPIMHITIFSFMPESPYYLLMKDKADDARRCLQILRSRSDVEEELETMQKDMQRQLSESGLMKDLFRISSNRNALFLCILLRLAQQFSGLAAFETYTQYMFQQAGSQVSEKTSSMIYTGVMTLSIASCVYFVKRLGRRPLIISSCIGCGIILAILSVYFYFLESTNISLSKFQWAPLAGMSVYVLFYAPGLGLLPTLMLGELFSTKIKSKAVSILNVVLAGCYFTVPKYFQSTSYYFGNFVPFGTFALSCIIAAILSYNCVIETRGRTLEEIQQKLKGKKL